MNILDAIKFIGKYAAHPMRIGAICPSSRYLARRMAAAIGELTEGDIIVELGAGTGAITSELEPLAESKSAKLYSIEFEESLAKLLKKKFTHAIIVKDSAENIGEILGTENFCKVKAIVSCLPLVSLPKPCVEAILAAAEEVLPQGARFIQFTYNLGRVPESLGFKKMRHKSVSFVALNLPPARVDIFERI